MAHDAALKAGQVLVDHDPAQAAWMVGMTQSMILNETDPQVDQRLRAAAGKWMQSVLGGQPSDDVLASLSATRGRMAIAAGDVKGGADLLVAASRRASPPQKGYYWAEAARALLAAGQTDPAVELLQRILTTPETGQVRIWTAQELKRLGVEPQPAAPRPG
jgi:predicted Zn-dependent protease